MCLPTKIHINIQITYITYTRVGTRFVFTFLLGRRVAASAQVLSALAPRPVVPNGPVRSDRIPWVDSVDVVSDRSPRLPRSISWAVIPNQRFGFYFTRTASFPWFFMVERKSNGLGVLGSEVPKTQGLLRVAPVAPVKRSVQPQCWCSDPPSCTEKYVACHGFWDTGR